MRKATVIEITNVTKQVPESHNAQFIGMAILFIIFLLSFGFLIYSGFKLTVAKGAEYEQLAEYNSIGKEVVFGERGMIVDRNGAALVTNKKSYDVFIDPRTGNLSELQKLFPDKKQEIADIFNHNVGVAIRLIHDASKDLVVSLKEKQPKGVELRHSYVRVYTNPKPFAHLMGYTGIASEDDLKHDSSLIINQIVGKSGLEFEYDTKLQGEKAYDTYEKDPQGNRISSTTKAAPKQGSMLTLSIYKKYQEHLFSVVKSTVEKYKAKGGSAVIIDIHTGEVMALVSYPSFDDNEFVSGISSKSYAQLINSPRTPLLNRPIAAQEPPGSTFKTLVATAALDTGAINESTVILAPGVIHLSGGMPFQDYRKRYNGNLTVRDGLMVSSNIFFCRTMLKLGIDRFIPYAVSFGIGNETGIDLPGEMPGRIPSPANKIALANSGASWLDPVWYPEGDSCNSAIGQGIALATPLQMANVAATIANGGTVYKPHVVMKITDASGKEEKIQPTVVNQQIASSHVLQVVREGMRLSVAGARGVASALRYVPMKVAAKTGTAEFGIKDKNGYSTAHGWVIGFYPYESPKYSFAMLIEGAGTSSAATFAMRDFLNSVK